MLYTRGNTLAPPAEAWQKAYDYDTDGNCIYEGWAESGIATSAARWTIVQRIFTGGNMVSEKWADGNVNADNVWDNRGSLTYA